MAQTLNEQETAKVIRQGISAVQAEDYLRGLSLLQAAYAAPGRTPPAEGLSFYALCVALVEKKYKSAIDLCKKAIEMQFYNPHHYANLTKIYLAAGSRKKAFDTLQQGLKMMPEDEVLLRLHTQLGRRAQPAIPFLSRSNPLNQMLGKARHDKKKTTRRKK